MSTSILSKIGLSILLSVGISFGVHSCDMAAREEADGKLTKLRQDCESLAIYLGVKPHEPFTYVSYGNCVLYFKERPRFYTIKPEEFDTLRLVYQKGKLSNDCKRTN
jgi:hypothetical protein